MPNLLTSCFLLLIAAFSGTGLWNSKALGAESTPPESAQVVLLVYSAENCPHCRQTEEFLRLLTSRYTGVKADVRDIWNNRSHFEQLVFLSNQFDVSLVTPSIFLGNRAWFGIGPEQQQQIEAAVRECLQNGCANTLELAETGNLDPQRTSLSSDESDVGTTRIFVPWVGEVDGRTLSLPLFTLIVGLLDSLNPCAFFVLLFLLSLLIHLRSKLRMLLVGGIFIFFSGLFYFLFMAARTMVAPIIDTRLDALSRPRILSNSFGLAEPEIERLRPRLKKKKSLILTAPIITARTPAASVRPRSCPNERNRLSQAAMNRK